MQVQKNGKEGCMYVGTAFGSGVAVYPKVGRQENGTLKITYHNPEVEVAEEEIMWLSKVLAFKEQFMSISAPADKTMVLSYMTWVKYDKSSALPSGMDGPPY